MAHYLNARGNTKNIGIGVLDEFMEWHARQTAGDIGAFEADRHVADMYRAVTLRELGVSTMPFRIESLAGKTLTTSAAYEDVTGLIAKPRRLLALTEQSRTLSGTAYYHSPHNRVVATAFSFLPPGTVRPRYVNNVWGGTLEAWEVSTTTGWRIVPLKDITYDWMPDASVGNAPPRRYPASAALSAAGIELNLDRFVELFFKRGAIKATIFTLEGNPPKPELERMEEWAASWLTGLVNAFTTKFFPVGKVNPLVIGEGVKELENQELEQAQSRKIAKAMMIPMAIFNSESSSGLGGGGVASQDAINFLKQCIMPECDAIAETWNEQIFDPLGFKWVWEYENLDELHDDENALAATMGTYLGNFRECESYEEWEAFADMTGVEYDEVKIKRAFAVKESRRVEAARLEAQSRQPAPADMDVSKPDPKQLTAGDEVKAIGGGNGLAITNTAAAVDGANVSTLRGDSVPVESSGIPVAPNPMDTAKTLERKQYRTWAAKASNAGKTFKFAYLDADEQFDLTGNLKPYPSVKSIGSVSQRFESELTRLVNDAWANEAGKITTDMRALVTQYVEDAFDEGQLDGGSTPDAMTDADRELVRSLTADQAQYIAKFATDVLAAATDSAQRESILRRIKLWAESIYSIGQRGWATAQSKTKRRIIWNTANDEATCPICAPLNGKIVEAGKPFAAGIYNEPAHPHCRCQTITYVEPSDYA